MPRCRHWFRKTEKLAIFATDHEHRILTHIGGAEIARIWNLRFVREVKPAPAEDPLELQFVEGRICIDERVKSALLDIDRIEEAVAHVTVRSGAIRLHPQPGAGAGAGAGAGVCAATI